MTTKEKKIAGMVVIDHNHKIKNNNNDGTKQP
jgi:hypothetical protein